jgi:hypothetical protein
MPLAMRASDRTAEKSRVFRGYFEVELKAATWILANRAINDALAGAGPLGFMFVGC